MAKRLEIVKIGDPVLRKRCRQVINVNDTVRELLDSMILTMRKAHGVGLAAPQVGVPKRMIVVETPEGLYEFVNPELVRGEGSEIATEGCLSVPGQVGEVERYARVCVTGLDREGKQIWLDSSGLLCRALQHEMDHLDGVLFVDKAKEIRQTAVPEGEERFLRVVFAGTPDFALPSLYSILVEGHDICLVITRPDKPAGRGMKMSIPAVKRFALNHRLPLCQPEQLRSEELVRQIAELQPDVLVVVAYGKLIPEEITRLPRLGAINLHPSLLPRYRGAAPIQRAIINGDTVTGVSVIQLSPRMDAGDIILQKDIEITLEDDYGSLSNKLAALGAEALCEALQKMAAGEVSLTPQDESQVTVAPPIKPEDELIRWSEGSSNIVNLVRALSPSPGAYTWRKGKKLKIFKMEHAPDVTMDGRPGELRTVGQRLLIRASDGWVAPKIVQPEGGRKMSSEEYLRGHPVNNGELVGEV
ncbi:MAG TPA: methionyl-tRNA formyltransferase [Firmicutes bacterium]|nr:methionyl-tRNA formyltransferase [Bacillota bacterium]